MKTIVGFVALNFSGSTAGSAAAQLQLQQLFAEAQQNFDTFVDTVQKDERNCAIITSSHSRSERCVGHKGQSCV